MKKNKTMRIASVLLIAVLLTTSIISGTFAKYVTTGETTDEARVAAFGVVVTGSGNLFAQNYWQVSDDNAPADAKWQENVNLDYGNEAWLTVESSNGDQLVAPGTTNAKGLNLSITGKPEVDVKITLAIDKFTDIFLAKGTGYPDMTTSTLWDTFDVVADYHPVLFTLKNGNGDVVNNGTKDLKNLTLADMQAALKTYSVYVDANTDLSDPSYSFSLSWEWAFEGPYTYPDVVSFGTVTVDRMDTLLGDIAAAKQGQTGVGYYDANDGVVTLVGAPTQITGDQYSTDISVALTLTVAQVD